MGTETVSCVELATLTVARVAPKKTILFDGVESKFVPVMVTDVPAAAVIGVNPVIVGI